MQSPGDLTALQFKTRLIIIKTYKTNYWVGVSKYLQFLIIAMTDLIILLAKIMTKNSTFNLSYNGGCESDHISYHKTTALISLMHICRCNRGKKVRDFIKSLQ